MAFALKQPTSSKTTGLYFLAAALTESMLVAYFGARAIFGPITTSPTPERWLIWAALLLAAHATLTLIALHPVLSSSAPAAGKRHLRPLTTLLFLAPWLVLVSLLQLWPDTVRVLVWGLLTPIDPFPTLATFLAVLLLFLARVLVVAWCLGSESRLSKAVFERSARVAVPAGLVLLGLFQASVYLMPVGNLFIRYWGVADALLYGQPYPVTDTEPPSLAAGAPPFIRDLPLFPLMLAGAFKLLGHNTVAAHAPGALFSALFPLALYLLLREATFSRVTALLVGGAVSLFPFLRFWVLNLPDPDPFFLTGLCFAGYAYLRTVPGRTGPSQGPGSGQRAGPAPPDALAAPGNAAARQWSPISRRAGSPAAGRRTPSGLPSWVLLGAACGVISLGRSEGLLYTAVIALGILATRPRLNQLAAFGGVTLAVFLLPAVALWVLNFGILWPQNFTGTVRLSSLPETLHVLRAWGVPSLYQRALGLDPAPAVALLLLVLGAVASGTWLAFRRDPRLLALIIPGWGNLIAVFFTDPGVTNAAHFADFFRHSSFAIPYLALAAAFALQRLRVSRRILANFCLLFIVLAIIREGDILANPTSTHRPGATQVLGTTTYLSWQSVAEHPLTLPPMDFRWNGQVHVAYPTSIRWPETPKAHFEPLDMAFDAEGRPFGYASAAALLLALGFAVLAETRQGKDACGDRPPPHRPKEESREFAGG